MNLEEFKKALSSDATEENKQLKKAVVGTSGRIQQKAFKPQK